MQCLYSVWKNNILKKNNHRPKYIILESHVSSLILTKSGRVFYYLTTEPVKSAELRDFERNKRWGLLSFWSFVLAGMRAWWQQGKAIATQACSEMKPDIINTQLSSLSLMQGICFRKRNCNRCSKESFPRSALFSRLLNQVNNQMWVDLSGMYRWQCVFLTFSFLQTILINIQSLLL